MPTQLLAHEQTRTHSSTRRKRHVLCGLSLRGIGMFAKPLLQHEYPQHELVGIVDIDEDRMSNFNRSLGNDLPTATPDRLQSFLQSTGADSVIVTGPDHTHIDHAEVALRLGLDVICEKPVVINCEQGRQLWIASEASIGKLVVAHNYRYSPVSGRIKQILQSGILGRPTQVTMDYLLDTYHGSSYFYRWNRQRKLSGGLSVHKCCHHFDLLNWWLDTRPVEVFAFGARNYFGPESPHRPAFDLPTPQRNGCPYHRKWFSDDGSLPEDDHLPAAWKKDGVVLGYPVQYPKALTIYDSEIDVEDTYSAVIRYENGASACYSVVFSSSWEGYTLGISGTHGRMEVRYCTAPQRSAFSEPEDVEIRVAPLFGEAWVESVCVKKGGHGGADVLLRSDLFIDPGEYSQTKDRLPSLEEGLLAVAVGEAVWRSGIDHKPFMIPDLLPEFFSRSAIHECMSAGKQF